MLLKTVFFGMVWTLYVAALGLYCLAGLLYNQMHR